MTAMAACKARQASEALSFPSSDHKLRAFAPSRPHCTPALPCNHAMLHIAASACAWYACAADSRGWLRGGANQQRQPGHHSAGWSSPSLGGHDRLFRSKCLHHCAPLCRGERRTARGCMCRSCCRETATVPVAAGGHAQDHRKLSLQALFDLNGNGNGRTERVRAFSCAARNTIVQKSMDTLRAFPPACLSRAQPWRAKAEAGCMH